jgi:ABC-type lipoprotein release transport system permease subunit
LGTGLGIAGAALGLAAGIWVCLKLAKRRTGGPVAGT